METCRSATRIVARLQCLVMLVCLVIGTLGICPDDCCHDPHHAEFSLTPLADSEAHHFCTMLACSHCTSFIAAAAERAEYLSWTRHPPLLRPDHPAQPVEAGLFRPPISLPA